jgi:hypothetical protein
MKLCEVDAKEILFLHFARYNIEKSHDGEE